MEVMVMHRRIIPGRAGRPKKPEKKPVLQSPQLVWHRPITMDAVPPRASIPLEAIANGANVAKVRKGRLCFYAMADLNGALKYDGVAYIETDKGPYWVIPDGAIGVRFYNYRQHNSTPIFGPPTFVFNSRDRETEQQYQG